MSNNVIIVGAPNVGKTTIFNKITWKLSKTANYDNVTFSNSNGTLRTNKDVQMIDTPGIYSIDSKYKSNNIVNYLLENKSKVCSIISSENIERDLYLTIDLMETGLLEYILINNINNSIESFNILNIERNLVSKVFEVNGNSGKGLKIFSNFVSNNIDDENQIKKIVLKYNKKIEKFIKNVEDLKFDIKFSKRFYAIQFLEENKTIIEHSKNIGLYENLNKILKKSNINQNDINSIFRAKKEYVEKVKKSFIENKNNISVEKKEFSNKNKIFISLWNNSYFIIFLFILSIIAIYFITFSEWTGTYLSDQMKLGFDKLKDLMESSMLNSNINEWWINFVKDGMFEGIFTTLSFIPWIIILTTLTTLLEQIGFLSKVSIATDKALDKFGISGRTLVSLFMGTGCNIPAIMMCKNSSNKKEKIITSMIIPLISCSARVVVYGWIVEAFNLKQYNFLFVFGLTTVSFIVALLAGLVFSNTLFRKNKTIFASEIISWRWPDASTLIKVVMLEVYSFVKKVIVLIFAINLIIWLLTNTSFTGIITDDDTSKSILRYLTYPFEYMLYPTGIFMNNSDSWKLSMSLIASFPAKEIAASNLELLFGGSAEFGTYLKTSLPFTWQAILCSWVCFFMFYLPCVATAVTIWKELGWKYLLINIISIFAGSYMLSCIIYSVVGSISLFANGIANVSIIVIFSAIIILPTLLLTIKLLRINNQNKGYIESESNNKILKWVNISAISLIAILIITNNALIMNI